MKRMSSTQQKILLIFLGGFALGCSGSPTRYYKILRQICTDWKNINECSFKRSVELLHKRKLLEEIHHKDGTISLKLTTEGHERADFLKIRDSLITITKQKVWDGLWRIVMFDIPEKKRAFRDILRSHLKTIGFIELQRSVFIFPYPCEDEMLLLA